MPVVRVYFWVTDGWLFETSWRESERERERERAGGRREESPTVRYWRMISCLHSSDPVSSEGEMRAGPIWNNRIPFAIVFLSVYVFHPRALCYFFDSRGKPHPPTTYRVGTVTHRRFRCVYAPLVA
ncbi:hypothetical protein ALC57_12901 [Trachymyrmex cornetzi]|uniref:Uncharacterized protein n=1 Tax=Trachymyrmex cornetzi TaxID=471704 RepID=A0A151J069_9HYME|nr:hypothetical protein ALC57_12901 [Trachymyrmex cornetzi]